jgi:hypothetical protein
MRVHLSIGRRHACRLALTTALLANALLSWTDPAAAASQTKAPAAQSKAPVPPASRAPIEAPAPDPSPTAEVTFATPQRFAIVSEPRANTRRLYTSGDFVPDPKAAGQGFIVDTLQTDGLQIRDTRSQKSIRVEVGGVIPGSGGRHLEGTVLLDGVEYRYVKAGASADPEPRLRQIRERRAHLEVDATGSQIATATVPSTPTVPPPVADRPLQLERRLDKTILEKVRVKPAGQDTYEISAADAQMAFDHGGKILMDAMSTIRPTLSFDQGMTFHVQSPVADGVLGPRGFRVVSPNLAERAGIEAGDVVLAVNGQPVNGFGDLFRLYQQVKRDQNLSVVELNLQRQGQLMTKTYRIR